MNILQQREHFKKLVNDRAQVFVRLVLSALDKLEPNGNLSPSFITSYHGFFSEVYDYESKTYPTNPNYNPRLSNAEHKLPENVALSTGFNWIEKVEHLVNITCVEIGDTYDRDESESETWQLNQVPQELFLNGSVEDIDLYIRERFSKEAKEAKLQTTRQKYGALFDLPTDEIKKVVKAIEENKDKLDRYPTYEQLDHVLETAGVM